MFTLKIVIFLFYYSIEANHNICSTSTPGGNMLAFTRISKSEKLRLLREYSHKPMDANKLDFFKKPTYLSEDGKVLHEYCMGDYAHLFENEKEYLKVLREDTYYDCSIQYDKQKKSILFFWTKPYFNSSFL